MMLPILISVSVAQGSNFFSACAAPARAVTSAPASINLLTWLKSWSCITILPGASRWLRLFLMGKLLEPSDRCEHEYASIAIALPARDVRHFPRGGSARGA